MKKLIVSICVFVAIVCALLVPAFGAGGTYEYHPDFNQPYVVPWDYGVMTMRYNTGDLLSDVRASTDLSVANDQYGTAYVYLKAENGHETNHYGTQRKGNVINSGKVRIIGQTKAVATFHSVERITRTNGEIAAWACNCQ